MGEKYAYGDFTFKGRWYHIASILGEGSELLITGIVEYIKTGFEPDENGYARAVFEALRPELDEERERLLGES